MKYKVLLITNEYNEELLKKLNSDFVVDCLNKDIVENIDKNNIKYLDYKNYIKNYQSLDELIEVLDKYRDYSFILSYKELKNDKYCNVNDFISDDINLKKYELKKLNLLIAGHDLKFINGIIPMLKQSFNIETIENSDYLVIDKKKYKEAIMSCDIVWCEWLVDNAVWFSNNLLSHQRLIIRAHRFELFKNYGYKLNMDNVEKIITVGYYYYEEFIKKFSIPRCKMTIIPNFIDTKKYTTDKVKDYKKNIAIIGTLPKRKGFHRALEVLFELKKLDKDYKLHVLGLNQNDLSSTKFDKEEASYYEQILRDIKVFNLEEDVVFTGWVDTKKYLKNIGYVLSVSDNEKPESFHLTPAEGLVSGALALATYWQGIEYIYPDYIIKKDVREIVDTIVELETDDKKYQKLVNDGRNFIIDNYDIEVVYKYFINLLEGYYER